MSLTVWSINSPTITDSEMEAKVRLGGKPLFLFDPVFVNSLARYFRNTADQNAESARRIHKELLEQEKLEKAREQARRRQEQAFSHNQFFGTREGLSSDDPASSSGLAAQYTTPQFSAEPQALEVGPGGQSRLSKDRGAGGLSDSGGSDRAGSVQPLDHHADESGSSDSEFSSEESESQEGRRETCQTVKLIMLKSEVTAPEGLAVVCLHHEFTSSPFMEVETESLTLRHHMMFDHDVLEAELLSPLLNDLTMWPRT